MAGSTTTTPTPSDNESASALILMTTSIIFGFLLLVVSLFAIACLGYVVAWLSDPQSRFKLRAPAGNHVHISWMPIPFYIIAVVVAHETPETHENHNTWWFALLRCVLGFYAAAIGIGIGVAVIVGLVKLAQQALSILEKGRLGRETRGTSDPPSYAAVATEEHELEDGRAQGDSIASSDVQAPTGKV